MTRSTFRRWHIWLAWIAAVPVMLWIGKDDALVRRIDIEGPLTSSEKSDIRRRLQLSKFDQPVKRHDGKDAPPVKDRPRKGHIGFQHLSRNNEPIQIRKARLQELK